jgi:peptidoglycan biosynthesis protein MviN/MurJ (putative lipid II flippase)
MNFAQILWIIYRKFGLYVKKSSIIAIEKCLVAALVMSALVWILQFYLDSSTVLALGYGYFSLFVISKIIASIIIYCSLCLAMRVKVADDLRRYAIRGIMKIWPQRRGIGG